MTDTPAPGERYPSRRTLRERAAAASTEAPAEPPLEALQTEVSQSAASQALEGDAQASTTDPPTADAREASPITASVRLPLREHKPDAAAPAAKPPARRRPTFARRFTQASAVAGVAAFVLAFALPVLDSSATEAAAPAASQQRLFSEFSGDDLPESLASVDAVEAVVADDSSPQQFAFRPQSLVNYPFAAPVMLTDPFGYRTAPVEQFHDAQDFAASEGTPIQVIADGTVTEAGPTTDGCGFGLKVEHTIDGAEVTSRYCHMQYSSHDYAVGDVVKMGDPAGKVGATGMAFGAHLHLALRVDDEPVDPMPFLAKYYRMDRPAETPAPAAK
ncbi:peptidoglycan DD-metalloendopeptidase family protein [Leucobacter sp. gxy201]|uniref:M23 family metallopeptidase n=1 Tax=Leucobacter sp. gxy201 TaxID=2957200 RepID=UPI003DA19742